MIKRQLDRLDRRVALGFLDLMEARFIDHFVRQGLPLRVIRRAANILREETKHDHPFSLDHATFHIALGRIFSRAAEADGDPKLLDVVNRQYTLLGVVEGILDDGVRFGSDGEPKEWRPYPKEAPHVVVTPMVAFGAPVVSGAWVPTATLVRAVQADGDLDTVAKDYGIDREVLEEALSFELKLAA
jgi:uncharacterized protein (DUF433 family)